MLIVHIIDPFFVMNFLIAEKSKNIPFNLQDGIWNKKFGELGIFGVIWNLVAKVCYVCLSFELVEV